MLSFSISKKLFNVVDHEILLKIKIFLCYKLDDASINWIRSYLSNRQQCIIEKNLRSKIRHPTGFSLWVCLVLNFH